MSVEGIAAAVAVVRCHGHLLLLRRAHNPLDPWSGHIALPGGRCEPGESPVDAACRETFEETGVLITPKELAAVLPVATAGSRAMLVQPYVFDLEQPPLPIPDPVEVAWVDWIPLVDLGDPSRHQRRCFVAGSEHPCVPVRDAYLWGFTYGVLARCFSWQRL